MKRNCCLLILLLLTVTSGFAQDPGFSQFFASPLTLNPALTGKFNGSLRVAGNYRNQWPTIDNAFITSTASLDFHVADNHLPDNNSWGVGVMAMSDKTASGILTSNYFSLSSAYHLPLDIDGYKSLGIGFQGTYASKILDGTQLHLEDQLDQQGGWTIPSQDAISTHTVTVNYFDMNVGLLYSATTNGANNYYIGASAYHINRPSISFLGDNNYTLNQRYTVHGGLSQPMSNGMYIHFSGLYSNQAGAYQVEAGGAVSLNVNNDNDNPTNVYLGTWLRLNNVTDAIIPYVGLEFGSFIFGMTYDVNISALKSASQSQGGVEISLIYIKKPSDGKRQIPCPKF